jgi:hypothetical protein
MRNKFVTTVSIGVAGEVVEDVAVVEVGSTLDVVGS